MAGNSKLVYGTGDGTLEPMTLVLYGGPGIGKTATLAKTRGVVILNASNGIRFIAGNRWPKFINTPADLGEAVAWLKSNPAGIQAVLLDGLDALYSRMVKGVAEMRADHLETQRALKPSLEAFLALQFHRLITMNEDPEMGKDGKPVRYNLDIAPRIERIIINRADFVLRAYYDATAKPAESYIQSVGGSLAITKLRSRKGFRDDKGNQIPVKLRNLLDVVGLPTGDSEPIVLNDEPEEDAHNAGEVNENQS